MDIRRATLADFEQIAITINKFKLEVGENPLTAQMEAAVRGAFERGAIDFYIVCEDGVVLGICSLSRCFSTYAAAPAALLDDVYIAREWRKKGLLRKLVECARNDAAAKGISSIMLGASAGDVGMYKSLGFDIELGTMLAMGLADKY